MKNKFLGVIDTPVFTVTLLFVIILTALGLFNTELLGALANGAFNFTVSNFSWWYLFVTAGYVMFCAWCSLSRFGRIKLGKDHEKPEYSDFAYWSMLFSAGVGVGLIFWGVAEPLMHYLDPPYGIAAATPEAAEVAMRVTIFHWGASVWSGGAVVALPIAYFAYRLGRPMTTATGLIGVLGDNPENTFWGKVINIFTAIAIIFSQATALGTGVMMIKYGMNELFGIPFNNTVAIGITAAVTVMFVYSAVRGVTRGIKIICEVNTWLMFGLIAFFFLFGPTKFILNLFTNTIGSYLQNFLWMSFYTDPVKQGPWLGWWTVFYFAWSISFNIWQGLFIARISRGRTVRQLVFGVMIVPLVFTFIWFTLLGGNALYAEIFKGANIGALVQKDYSAGIFALLSTLPFHVFIGIIVIISIVIFFVTGADAAAVVLGMIMSKGNLNPANGMKILMGSSLGIICIILMTSGGLPMLQTAVIAGGLPISFAIVVYAWSMVKAFQNDVLYEKGNLPETQHIGTRIKSLFTTKA
ncbi:BCCT family transporter [Candidatus Formimonas warabiya]|uniref:BCCT family transporter n=1 Tax=Formimonas warabiya TaxID=1761012 RepID=A0A3G1KWY2_FORW1|nr:BCCT family transporter [Candidatus Formimonas warabiya]ATW26715.1 hypothetical protein DCMF_19860 [Candidatus Formimonas warabiya]